ncbi:MAG: cobyric acid synthase CobQ, partial [Pseudomonadota bacterium]
CGGFQMLGRRVADPDGIEGPPSDAIGLGWFDMETVLTGEKTLLESAGVVCETGLSIRGYEMHIGRSTGPALDRPFLRLEGRPEGAVSEDGQIIGCYVHGLFADDTFRQDFLRQLGTRVAASVAYERQVETTLDQLAEHLEHHLDMDSLMALTGLG